MDLALVQPSVLCFSITIFLVVCSAAGQPYGNETDVEALLNFKAKIISDPFNILRSWNESVHVCKWPGVTCGRRHQRVIRLYLKDKQLIGSISPFVGNMTFLKLLSLQNNSFIYQIPQELGRLRRLKYLWLAMNSLDGKIPASLSGCSNLIEFDVGYNNLTGEIPVQLGSLLRLKIFSINVNKLTGNIPLTFQNLSLLEGVYAGVNALAGSIPEGFGKLANLQVLGLGSNFLSGVIPPEIFNLTFLVSFDASVNQLQGTLPPELGFSLPNLMFLGLSGNMFSGSIPYSLSNSTNMVDLLLSQNKFTGKVPTFKNLQNLQQLCLSDNKLGNKKANELSFINSLTNATNLEVLELQENNFGGLLPESLGNLSTMLVRLCVDNNHLSGSIPIGIENLVNLENLQMFSNHFTGSIPFDIGKLKMLQKLGLSYNKLSGNIPSSLGNLSLLTELILGFNNFQGIIPSTLGKLTNLLALDIGANDLSGPIPGVAFGSLPIYFLDLSGNRLNGSMPMEIGNLKNLQEFDLSNNALSGEIPASLGSCVRLEKLSLASNFFRGRIPSSLGSLRGLQLFDLSQNNFSGRIPEYFGGLDLKYLNISFNDFEGPVPEKGVFRNATAAILTGNLKLCGGIPDFQLAGCASGPSQKSGTHIVLVLIISTVSGVLGLILLLGFLIFYRFKKIKKRYSSESPLHSLPSVSYQSLLQATSDFSSAKLIGTGSFGSVYAGTLEDGTKVAVKVLNLLHHGASKSFDAECKALRNIRHRNIVKVMTACSGIDYQGNDFKALVYEFMVHGCLEEWLHPNSSLENSNKLNLLQRLNIAIDVACALDYLHNHSGTPFVHCDLKPANVLLDDELVGHVGDFGITRSLPLPGPSEICSSTQSQSIGVRGSIGYTAPEYGMGSDVSTSGDVYSFGILVLEMFTGKRPTDDMFREGLNLHRFVEAALPERVAEILDPILLRELEEEVEEEEGRRNHNHQQRTRTERIRECLVPVCRIGVACSVESPSQRMSMSDAFAKLQSIKKEFLRN